MKKKILICLLLISLVTGCSTIQNLSVDDVVDKVISTDNKLCNHIMKGYKYYLPRGLSSSKIDEYNEIIVDDNTTYYLYVDIVSYNLKATLEYSTNSELYYSSMFEIGDNKGIVNVKKVEDNFIIQVKYNYARVELEVSEDSLNEGLWNALTMVTTIQYNDDVIESLVGKSSYSSAEEVIDIFDDNQVELNYLESADSYSGNEEEEYDPDVIN